MLGFVVGGTAVAFFFSQLPPRRSHERLSMSRTIVNLILDTLLLSMVIAIGWTTVVLRFAFPPPSETVGWSLWGASFDFWFEVLVALLGLVGAAILVHVMLHWSWVCGVVTRRVLRWSASQRLDEGIQTIYGVGLLIAVVTSVGVLTALAVVSIQPPH